MKDKKSRAERKPPGRDGKETVGEDCVKSDQTLYSWEEESLPPTLCIRYSLYM